MNVVTIEDWAILESRSDRYSSPDGKSLQLHGCVHGHPLHKDGTFVLTSVILSAKCKEVSTLNTKYVLGKVKDSYRDWYFKEFNKTLNEDCPFSEEV